MRFPFSLTRSMSGYLLKKKLAGQEKFPLVLMLEPLHACNLSCSGCGRIREYAATSSKMMSIGECLDAIDECGAPIVSICGGEPLIYPGIDELVAKTIERRKHVYLCTNGVQLVESVDRFKPTDRLFINVHLDGIDSTHDKMVNRRGVFAKATAGIVAAKRAGFMVCTNTTIYAETSVQEVVSLFEHLNELSVDGLLLSPAYGYESIHESEPNAAGEMFMDRDQIHERFRQIRPLVNRFKLLTSPVYMDFLCGNRDLSCAAWANPTRNVCGWKGPCYLITDAHYSSYQELLERTDWDKLSPIDDPRCENCLVHCGFEPAAVFAANRRIRDIFRMAIWQIGGSLST